VKGCLLTAVAVAVGVVSAADYSHIAAVEYHAKVTSAGRVLLPDEAGRAVTTPFEIIEKEEGVLGNWLKAEDRFVKAAATATLCLDADRIRVVFNCPVPKGMTVKKDARSAFSGDEVEFFIRPDVTKPEYYQYCVNAAGITAANRFLEAGSPDKKFVSRFVAQVKDVPDGFAIAIAIPRTEVLPEMPREGDVFTANFARVGDTCNGLSSWVKVGAGLHAPERFGKVIWGGAPAYFARKLLAAKEAVGRLSSEDARAAGTKAYSAVADSIAKHAMEPSSFESLERMFADFDQAMISILLQGRPLAVYNLASPWGNDVEPASSTRMLENVLITVARNSRAWYPLGVKNMSDVDFIGQVKVFDTEPGYRFSFENTCGAARHFKLSEAVAKDLGGGVKVFDPFVQLPMNSLLRLCAGRTTVIWLEIDSHGLKSGRHKESLVIKGAVAGFGTLSFPMVIDVKDADLDTVECPRAAYTDIPARAVRKLESRVEASRRLNSFVWQFAKDTIYVTPWPGFWPRFDKSGLLGESDYGMLDRLIQPESMPAANDRTFAYGCSLPLSSSIRMHRACRMEPVLALPHRNLRKACRLLLLAFRSI